MAQAFDGIASDVEQLSERLRELERRVSALEGQPEIEIPPLPHLRAVRGPRLRDAAGLSGAERARRRATRVRQGSSGNCRGVPAARGR